MWLPVADFVPLANWIPAVVAFIAGTLVPVIYRRLSFEGISLQQAHDVRLVSPSSARVLTFSTVLKVANVGGSAVVLDRIRAPRSLSLDGVELRFVGTELKVYEPGVPVRLPPSEGEGGQDFPPVVIASPEERILAVGFRFSYPAGDSPASQLLRHIEREGLVTGFRINGKYRDYTLTIGGGGYEETADGSPLAPMPDEPALERELRGARLTGEDLREADLTGRDLHGAELTGTDLRGAKLVGANLSGADLAGADLREADLADAALHGARLTGADLRGADLSGTGLHEADLRGADLRGSDLDGADFAGADLGGANLEGAKLTEASLGGVVWSDSTRWPKGFGGPPGAAS